MVKFSQKDLSTKIVAYIILFGGGIIMIYPLIYCFMASLLTLDEYLVSGLLPVPGDWYREVCQPVEVFRSPGCVAVGNHNDCKISFLRDNEYIFQYDRRVHLR
mgnify:CR=1 FL=1